MRKRITRILLAAVALCVALNAEAYDFQTGGICYNITSEADKTVEVTWGDGYYSGKITIPATVINSGTTYTVTAIGKETFYWCSSLVSVNIPDGVTSIGESAFYDCRSLTSINIPDGVTEIGNSAFNGCRSLTSIEIPDGVKEIGNSTFLNCTGLTSINIPDGVTEIGNSAFTGCGKLTSINIPDGVTSIGESAFYGCSSLTSINIPNGVTEIGNSAFLWCSSLTSIEIPDGVTSIGNSTFLNCTGLTSVTLGSSLETIGESAFENCSNLSEIHILATVPPVCGTNCFSWIDKEDCTLNIPEGTADAYKAADGWKDFANIVETDFSGSEEIAADADTDVKVYAAAGRIVVENAAAGTPLAVYSADGVQIYGGAVSDTFTEIPVPAGKLYIVKCGNAVFKTVM